MRLRKPLTFEALYGRLKFMGAYRRHGRRISGYFTCLCGNKIWADLAHIRNGHTQSCGCYQKECVGKANSIHNMKDSTEYRAWTNMLTRCRNPKWSRFGNLFLGLIVFAPMFLTEDIIQYHDNWPLIILHWITQQWLIARGIGYYLAAVPRPPAKRDEKKVHAPLGAMLAGIKQ